MPELGFGKLVASSGLQLFPLSADQLDELIHTVSRGLKPAQQKYVTLVAEGTTKTEAAIKDNEARIAENLILRPPAGWGI